MVINFVEGATDVVMQFSGTLNTGSAFLQTPNSGICASTTNGFLTNDPIISNIRIFCVGSATTLNGFALAIPFTNELGVGTGLSLAAASSMGGVLGWIGTPAFGIPGATNQNLYVPTTYITGTQLSGSATYANTNLAGMGISITGSAVSTFSLASFPGGTPVADSLITVNVIP